jgi:hypothetical protein
MPVKPSRLLVLVAGGLLPFAAAGCSSTTVTESRTSWYTTCGDPVCRGYQKPVGVAACTTEKAGGACGTEGARCDPEDSCNRLLLCSASDPKLQGCPISTRAVKRDVHYLDDEARERYARELRAVKLATYRYRGPDPTPRLGFLLEDRPPGEAVDAERDMADLYGYTSMAVAAFQVQARQIEALQEEVARLRAELRGARPSPPP